MLGSFTGIAGMNQGEIRFAFIEISIYVGVGRPCSVGISVKKLISTSGFRDV
jgi:hypothetical protein